MTNDGYSAGSARLTISPHWGNFFQEVDSRLRAYNRPLVVRVEPENLHQFRARLETQMRTMGSLPPIKIEAELDADLLRSQLTTQVASLDRTINLDTRLDTTEAMMQLGSLRAYAERPLNLRVALDTGGAAGELAGLNALLNQANNTITARLNLDTAGAMTQLESFRMYAEHPIRVRLDLDTGGAMAGLISLQAMIAALSAQIHAMPSIPGNMGGGLSGLVGGFGQLASVAGVAKVALMGLAAVSLVPLLGQVAQAAGVIALLPAMATAAASTIGTLVLGFRGIGDAVTAQGELAKASATEQAAAAKQVADAQRAVSEANEDVGRTAENGARSIRQAERQSADAYRDSQRAQEALTRAREEATEQIEDLNLALRGSALDEESAMIAVERARRRLQRGDFTGPDADIDRRAAANDYNQAVQRLAEVRESNNDLRLEAEAATKAGVEGSQQVVTAKEGVAAANQRVADAEENLRITQQNVAEANEDALQRVTDAMFALEQAQAQAQPGLDAFNKAMAELSPNAQDVVRTIGDLRDEWGFLQNSVQDELFDGISGRLREMSGTYIPVLTTGLGNLAGVLNGGLKQAMDWLTTPGVSSDISAVLQNTADALGPLLNGLGNLGKAMLDIAYVGSELLPEVTGAFEEGTGGFAEAISEMRANGDLEGFMREAMDTFAQLWRIVKNFAGVVAELFDGSDATGESWLTGIENTLAEWKETLSTDKGKQDVRDFFAGIKDTIDGLITLLEKLSQIKIPGFNFGDPTPPKTDEVERPVIDPNGNPVLDPETGKPVTETTTVYKTNPETGEIEREEDQRSWIEKALTDTVFETPDRMPLDNGRTLIKQEDGTYKFEDDLDGPSFDHTGRMVDHGGMGEGSIGDRIADFFVGSGNHEGSRGKLEARIDGSDPSRKTPWERFTAWLGFGEDAPRPGSDSELGSELQRRLETGEGLEGGSLVGDPAAWGEKWSSFSETVRSGWNDKVSPALQGVRDKTVEIGQGFIDHLQTSASTAWNDLKDTVVTGWREHISPAWETLKTEGLGGLADSFVEKITNGAVTSWRDLPAAIAEGAGQIVDEHFPWLSSGLDTLTSAFGKGIDAIGSLWDGLKAKLATPIDWVISNVFNDGIIKFWNAVAPKIGLDTIEPIGLIGQGAGKSDFGKVKAYSDGGVHGVMSGYSPGVDDRFIAVGGGEAIMRPEWTRAVGPDYVNEANRAARIGGVEGVRKFVGGFAGGGIVESIVSIAQEKFPGLSVTSSYRDSNDLHGQGKAVDLSNQSGGGPSTPLMQDAARFFYENYGPKLAELIHWPLNGWQNIDEGAPFNFGEPTNSQHTDHVHVASHQPLKELSEEERQGILSQLGSWASGVVKSVSNVFRNLVADQFEKPLAALGSTIPDQIPGLGEFGRIPKAAYNTLTKAALDKVRGAAASKDNASGSSGAALGMFGGNAEDYAREIIAAAKDRGLPPEAAAIGIATALVESNMRMYANHADPESLNYPYDLIGSDHDSVGLFQQRNNGAWGTTEQRMNPRASAGMFFDRMMQVGWEGKDRGAVAQQVQVSAFPERYAQRMGEADQVVTRLYDAGGVLEPNSFALNLSGQPEAVFTHEEWQVFGEFMRIISRPDFITKLAGTIGMGAELGVMAPRDFAEPYPLPAGYTGPSAAGTAPSGPSATGPSSTGTGGATGTMLAAPLTAAEPKAWQTGSGPGGSLTEADMLANMSPEARKTFEENGQAGAPGGGGFDFESALAEATGITIDHRLVEQRMADWATTYSGKWANWNRDTVSELIDDAASPFGMGISVGQIVTQNVPDAVSRLARLAELASRGYNRTNGR